MFPLAHITLTAVSGAMISLVVALMVGRGADAAPVRWSQTVPLALIVGVSIVLWRLAGNTATLNEDPIAFISPNDVLCPVITYVCLSVYAGLRGLAHDTQFARVRGALTIVTLIVNVVTI